MKRYLPVLLAVVAAPMVLAQDGPATHPPQHIQVESDGKCRPVKPGDVVHFALTIQSVEYAHAVYAHLQMHLGRTYTFDPSGLPAPDFRTLGGGSVATRDAQQGGVYHFAFTVPRDVMTGIYHGAGVYVTAADNSDLASGSRNVEVNHRTLEKVRDFCLIVVGPFGGDGRPLVTDFRPGPIDKNK